MKYIAYKMKENMLDSDILIINMKLIIHLI